MFLFTFLPSFFMAFLAQKPIYTIFYKKTDECYLRWQRVTTNDNKWQRVATNDNNWYNEWQRVTTGGIEWREVTTSGNFGQTFFFQIMWCWYEPFFISSRQRLLQTEVIDVFKIYINLSKSTIVVFLKLSTSYLHFIIKMCFFFFNEIQMFCFVLQKDARLILTCFVIKQKPLVKTMKTHGKFLYDWRLNTILIFFNL